ncbi:hypothetical protein RDI58_012599 [Solanum bulbocastanum]|uniref:Uncharacterized protein n=1 Tax=Solanum bulbocastanum TaxID=147425 RepID=A0AAN8YEI1_SOLBU
MDQVDMGESGSAFNTRLSENENFNFGVGEDHLNNEDRVATFSTSPSFTIIPPFTATPTFNTVIADGATADSATDDDIDVGPAQKNIESEAELVKDDDEEDYGSDVHEEVRELRAEKRSFQRRKRKKRLTADNEDVPVGETGADLDFDETEKGKVSHKGRLGGDKPYFASSDKDNFELDEDECCNDDEHPPEEINGGLQLKD